MTTTLRPAGEERTQPDGSRSRRFSVCVNGRPVGAVRLEARPGPGGMLGAVAELHIDPGERRRGRATVAVLAGEEVLRSWGCTRLGAEIPAGPGEAAALRLADALGYRITARNMDKHLTEPPLLPEGTEAAAPTAEGFTTWLRQSNAGYLAALRDAGYAEADARARADADLARADAELARLLSQGSETPDTVLRVLRAGGEDVGTLWLDLDHTAPDGRRLAWVMDVEVAERHRGRGHGRTLMLLAERECLAAGRHDLGLNVFAGNAPANSLYRSLGYRTFRTVLIKYP